MDCIFNLIFCICNLIFQLKINKFGEKKTKQNKTVSLLVWEPNTAFLSHLTGKIYKTWKQIALVCVYKSWFWSGALVWKIHGLWNPTDLKPLTRFTALTIGLLAFAASPDRYTHVYPEAWLPRSWQLWAPQPRTAPPLHTALPPTHIQLTLGLPGPSWFHLRLPRGVLLLHLLWDS